MNNKGFTLIEIIAVVGLLALIGVMIGSNLVSMNQKQNEKNYINYKETIASGACIFFESKDMKFYSTSTGAINRTSGAKVSRDGCLSLKKCYTSVSLLIEYGYIDEHMKDPTTQEDVTPGEYACVVFDKGSKSCYYQDQC